MEKVVKEFPIEVVERRKDGGRIRINTAGLDRDRDRVLPAGARLENYQKNPVMQWGHNYRDPWATIGKANALTITPDAIDADFTLRPAANDQDPQNIIRLLWEGEWVRTSSIGFIPKTGKPNAEGGTDFTEWELLEFSLVPIPANQDALRLAIKGLSMDNAAPPAPADPEPKAVPDQKRGRVLSAKNEASLKQASELLTGVLAQLDEAPPDDGGEGKGAPDGAATEDKATSGETGTSAPLDARELAELFEGFEENLKEVLS
jgi:hypothetical protein